MSCKIMDEMPLWEYIRALRDERDKWQESCAIAEKDLYTLLRAVREVTSWRFDVLLRWHPDRSEVVSVIRALDDIEEQLTQKQQQRAGQ